MATIRMLDLERMSVREILALAISLEEEHGRVYANFAEEIRGLSLNDSVILERLSRGASARRQRLVEYFNTRFGPHIPFIRRKDVRNLMKLKALWLVHPLDAERVRDQVNAIGAELNEFYACAAKLAGDVGIYELLNSILQDDTLNGNRTEAFETNSLQRPEHISWMRRLLGRIALSDDIAK